MTDYRRSRRALPMLAALVLIPALTHAAADRQNFFGIGAGFAVARTDQFRAGLALTASTGYNFDSRIGAGMQLGWSNPGGFGGRLLDFGGFFQLTEPDSGLYGKLFLQAIHTAPTVVFAPGLACGMLVPSVGDLHLNPELAYKFLFTREAAHLIMGTFGVVWDF